MKLFYQLQRNRRHHELHNEAGQGMTEYLIITALIAVAAIGVLPISGKPSAIKSPGLLSRSLDRAALPR